LQAIKAQTKPELPVRARLQARPQHQNKAVMAKRRSRCGNPATVNATHRRTTDPTTQQRPKSFPGLLSSRLATRIEEKRKRGGLVKTLKSLPSRLVEICGSRFPSIMTWFISQSDLIHNHGPCRHAGNSEYTAATPYIHKCTMDKHA